jgi:hypothetical protein
MIFLPKFIPSLCERRCSDMKQGRNDAVEGADATER